jgi:hypothetical protein
LIIIMVFSQKLPTPNIFGLSVYVLDRIFFR